VSSHELVTGLLAYVVFVQVTLEQGLFHILSSFDGSFLSICFSAYCGSSLLLSHKLLSGVVLLNQEISLNQMSKRACPTLVSTVMQ
jgi:hypothetical protein